MSAKALVVFSPLPPMQTGIADYSYELLTLLRQARDCTVVCEDGQRGLRAPPGVNIISMSDYRRHVTEYAATLHLYHLGNNPDHIYMLPALAERPGVVVLHDPSLHHLLDCATAARGDFAAYGAAIAAEYGAPGRVLAQQFLGDRLREPAMIQDMPMLTGIVGPALGIVVHSRFAAAKVLAHGAKATIIPHHYAPPTLPLRGREAIRVELGIGEDEIVFLSIGFVTHTKCIDRALNALAHVADALPPFRYIVAGDAHKGETDIRRLANQLGLGERVITKSFVPEQMFYELLAAADVVINLRHPVGGETSGTLIRALGQGACAVVVDRGPFAEIAAGAVARIAWGANFDRRLAALLLQLAREPSRRQKIGAAAAKTIAIQHLLEDSASRYLRAIAEAEAREPPTWRTTAHWSFHPASTPRPQQGRLWQRLLALPFHETGLQAIGFAASPISAPGWSVQTRPLAALGNAQGTHVVDLVLIEADADGFAIAWPDCLRHVNQMLHFGGLLVLNLTRAADGPRGALETHIDGTRLLEARGFTVQFHATGPDPELTASPEVQLEEHCWRAVKNSEFFARVDWAA